MTFSKGGEVRMPHGQWPGSPQRSAQYQPCCRHKDPGLAMHLEGGVCALRGVGGFFSSTDTVSCSAFLTDPGAQTCRALLLQLERPLCLTTGLLLGSGETLPLARCGVDSALVAGARWRCTSSPIQIRTKTG